MHEQQKRRKYDAAFKADVLRMVDSGQSVSYTAEALGISQALIYRWKNKNKMGKEKSSHHSDLSVENQQLKERVRQLEAEREILKKSFEHFQPRELSVLYELIDTLSSEFAISTLCSVLGASRTAYYRYRRGGSYRPTVGREEKRLLVESVFSEHKRRYGSRRITAELRDRGYGLGRHQVRSLMKASGLRPIQPKSFVPRTTDSTHKRGYCGTAHAAQPTIGSTATRRT